MFKKYFIIFILFLLNSGVFALPGSPMDGWYWDAPGITLKGKQFKLVSESYEEQKGYAVVNGQSIQFWLYDTITYHDGKTEYIYDCYIPRWIENLGYVIDYDNIKIERPYNVPSSVKKLMQQRGCDTAVARFVDCVQIIEFLNSKNIYKLTTYPLVRQ